MPPTRRLAPAQRRAELLAAGLALLDEGGPTALTAEAVAERAETSRPLVLHYFRTLRGLQTAVAAAAADRLLQDSLATPVELPDRRVTARMEAFVASVAAHPQASLAVLRGPWAGEPELDEALDRLRRSLFDDLVGGGVAHGLPASTTLEIVARAWMALFEEAVIGWLRTPEVDPGTLVFLLEDSLARLVEWIGEPAVRERLAAPAPQRRPAAP